MSITYSESVFVALVTQHAMHMRHIVICGLYGSTRFFHIISKCCDILVQGIEHKICVLIFPTILSETLFNLRRI